MTLKAERNVSMIRYSDAYRESCFIIWYQAGRPRGDNMIEIFPNDVEGRKPPIETVWKWMREYGWHERADVLDAEVAKRIELQAVEERVEMLTRQAEVAKDLQERGYNDIVNKGFEKTADALRAIFGGAELERNSRGLSTALIKVSEMDDSTLQETVKKLFNKATPDELNQLVDGEIIGELPENATESSEEPRTDPD